MIVARALTGVSERRAGWLLGEVRSTQRYTARRREDEVPLLKRIGELVLSHPRRGAPGDLRHAST